MHDGPKVLGVCFTVVGVDPALVAARDGVGGVAVVACHGGLLTRGGLEVVSHFELAFAHHGVAGGTLVAGESWRGWILRGVVIWVCLCLGGGSWGCSCSCESVGSFVAVLVVVVVVVVFIGLKG